MTNKENISETEPHIISNSFCSDTVDQLVLGNVELLDSNINLIASSSNQIHNCADICADDSSENMLDSNIDFSDDSYLSHVDDIDQYIFASARTGKITLGETIKLLSSRKRRQSQSSDEKFDNFDCDAEDNGEDNGDRLIGIFCPFTFDVVYTPKRLSSLLRSLWSNGIETHDTHFFERGRKIGIIFSSVTNANRFLKFCCCKPPVCDYYFEHRQQLEWTNLINIQKKWKFKIKTKLSEDSTALRLIIRISFPKSDIGFISKQFKSLNNFCL
jgi:hypothetical protein